MEGKCLLVVLFSVLLTFKSVAGLRCYACSCTEKEIDQTCASSIDTKTGMTVVNCNKKYCTSVRIEYKDPRNKVASITRTCEDQPSVLNDVLEDETYRSYFVSCQTDLCNGGLGKSAGDNGPKYLGDKSTIYCNSILHRSAATRLLSSTHYMVLALAVVHLALRNYL